MTDHVFNIAFHVDEKSIVDHAVNMAAKELVDATTKTFLTPAWSGNKLSPHGEDILKELLECLIDENKEVILQSAIDQVTKKICSSKKYREATKDDVQ